VPVAESEGIIVPDTSGSEAESVGGESEAASEEAS
jgi:hypothetical protein